MSRPLCENGTMGNELIVNAVWWHQVSPDHPGQEHALASSPALEEVFETLKGLGRVLELKLWDGDVLLRLVVLFDQHLVVTILLDHIKCD